MQVTAKASESCGVRVTGDCGDRGRLPWKSGDSLRPWNSAEGNREPEKGSKIGPDVLTYMEGELGSR